MTIEELMAEPHILLEWVEPWPGRDPEGGTVDTTAYSRASVADCISLQRARSVGHNYPLLSERDLLLDFIAINWAYVPGEKINHEKTSKEKAPQLCNVQST